MEAAAEEEEEKEEEEEEEEETELLLRATAFVTSATPLETKRRRHPVTKSRRV